MAMAAKEIIYTQKSTSDIAMDLGYNDLQAFTKAFKKVYQVSPAKYRQDQYSQIQLKLEQVWQDQKDFIGQIEFHQTVLPPF